MRLIPYQTQVFSNRRPATAIAKAALPHPVIIFVASQERNVAFAMRNAGMRPEFRAP
jgi:hypothetical protein